MYLNYIVNLNLIWKLINAWINNSDMRVYDELPVMTMRYFFTGNGNIAYNVLPSYFMPYHLWLSKVIREY